MPDDNGKQFPKVPYTSKYQRHIPFSYDYKLVYVDDKISKPFKTYLREDAVDNFINSMIEERKKTF